MSIQYFGIWKHCATKLCNVTNFKIFFQAVMIDSLFLPRFSLLCMLYADQLLFPQNERISTDSYYAMKMQQFHSNIQVYIIRYIIYIGIYYPIYNIYRCISSDILYTGRLGVSHALTFAVIWYCYPLSTVHRSRIEVRDVLWFFDFVFNLINTNVDYKDYEQLNLLQRRFNYKLNGKHHSVSQILSYFHRRNIFSSNVIIC